MILVLLFWKKTVEYGFQNQQYRFIVLRKILFSSFLLPIILNASLYNMEDIKQDFHNEVVVKALKKVYKTDSTLQEALKKRVGKFSLTEEYFQKAKKHLLKQKQHFSTTQFVTLIDLSKQVLIISIWDKEKQDFFPIGYDFISSGDIEREIETKKGEDHYVKTPSGLFPIKSGWRSYGKTNTNDKAKPYGKKGRFVFYFGKHMSVRYNTFDKYGTKIKDKKKWKLIKDKLSFAIHAHSTTTYLGQARSHGCVRMSDELNIFMDNNFVFFKHLLKNKKWIHPYEDAPKNPKNHELAGKYLLVINSAS